MLFRYAALLADDRDGRLRAVVGYGIEDAMTRVSPAARAFLARQTKRSNPNGGGQGVGGDSNNLWPDGNYRKFPPNARPKRDKGGASHRKRGPYRGKPPFDSWPQRKV